MIECDTAVFQGNDPAIREVAMMGGNENGAAYATPFFVHLFLQENPGTYGYFNPHNSSSAFVPPELGIVWYTKVTFLIPAFGC